MNKLIDVFDLVDSLREAGGEFFTVTFTKRTNGEERTVVGRFGVTKDLKGGELKYDPREKGLFVMWINPECRRQDGKDNGYRAIPADSVSYLAAKGRKFVVSDGMAKEV